MDVSQKTLPAGSRLSDGSAVLVLFVLAVAATGCFWTRDAPYDPREAAIDALFRAAERGDGNAQCELVSLYSDGQLDIVHRLDRQAQARLKDAIGPVPSRGRIDADGPDIVVPDPAPLDFDRSNFVEPMSDEIEDLERLHNVTAWSFRCLAQAEAALSAETRASIDRTTVSRVRDLAKQGHPEGQLFLGMAFAVGVGVFENPVLAHMWFNIALANGNAIAARGREALEAGMTAQQIDRAVELARRCVGSGYQEC